MNVVFDNLSSQSHTFVSCPISAVNNILSIFIILEKMETFGN